MNSHIRRIKFQNSRKLNLTGNLYKANSDAVVVMAHGFIGDGRKFEYIAQCLNTDGYNVLTFDFSGCGESDNDKLTCAKEVDDLQSAINYALNLDYKQLALWGHSLGSRICLQSYRSEVKTMVLTGALLGPVNYDWKEYFTEEQLVELAKFGFITQKFELGPRRSIIIDKQMLDDFADFDQQNILSKVACSVLVINGDDDGDSEELMLKGIAAKAMHFLPSDSRHEIVHGAAHNFLRYVDKVIDLGLSWLKEHMPANE